MALGSKKKVPKAGPALGSRKKLSTKFHSDIQESATAERLGGTKVRGSGCTPNHKGDVKTDDFLVENKTTEHASMSIKAEWLEKISHEAMVAGRRPALEFEIRGIDSPSCEKQWVCVPASVFADLVQD